MIRKNSSNHGRVMITKNTLLSFDEFFLTSLQMWNTIEKFVKITTVRVGGVFQSVKMRDKPQKLFARVSILNKQVLM